MKKHALVLAVLLLGVVMAGCLENRDTLVSSYTQEDGRRIFEMLLQQPEFKKVADRVAPLTFYVDIMQADHDRPTAAGDFDEFYYVYDGGNVTSVPQAKPDYTLKTSSGVVLAVLNADDGFRVFTCAAKDNAVTITADNALYAASFYAAKKRITDSAEDCAPVVGQTVTFRGRTGVLVDGTPLGRSYPLARMSDSNKDFLAFNKYRAPIGWVPDDLSAKCASLPEAFCAGVANSASSDDLAACHVNVALGYAPPGWPVYSGGTHWTKGKTAAQIANRAAEEAACGLIFGGAK